MKQEIYIMNMKKFEIGREIKDSRSESIGLIKRNGSEHNRLPTVLGEGVDQHENPVFRVEVEVTEKAKGGWHKDGDIVIWRYPLS